MKDALALVFLCAVYAHAHTYEVTYEAIAMGDKHQTIVEADSMEEAIKKGRTSEYGERKGIEALEIKKIRLRYSIEIDGVPYRTVEGFAPLREEVLFFLNQGRRFRSLTIRAAD